MAQRSASLVVKVNDGPVDRLGRRVRLGQWAPIPRPRTVSTVIHDRYQVDRYRRLTLPAPVRMVKVIAARDASGATEAMETHLATLMNRTEVDCINPDYLVRKAPQDKVL